MTGIDPALLQSQWLQFQQSQLSKSAIIPQVPQYATQYAPQQPHGELISNETIAALSQFIEVAGKADIAARQYIGYLEQALTEQVKLIGFSAAQDELINQFLYDRDFALQYARFAWAQLPVDNRFASDLADVYLELAALSPYQQSQQRRNPEYTGNPNPTFAAQLVPQPQNFIPPLPNSNGNGNNGITMEQYLIAQQQGQAGAARAAAMQNPASLYAALFQ